MNVFLLHMTVTFSNRTLLNVLTMVYDDSSCEEIQGQQTLCCPIESTTKIKIFQYRCR